MVKDAEKNQEEDNRKKESIENRNKLDQLSYSLEKLVKENKDKIPESMTGEVDGAIKKAKEAIESGDNQRIVNEIENMNQLTGRLSSEMYKTAGAQGGQKQNAGQQDSETKTQEPPTAEGEVIDAEFEDIGKSKDS